MSRSRMMALLPVVVLALVLHREGHGQGVPLPPISESSQAASPGSALPPRRVVSYQGEDDLQGMAVNAAPPRPPAAPASPPGGAPLLPAPRSGTQAPAPRVPGDGVLPQPRPSKKDDGKLEAPRLGQSQPVGSPVGRPVSAQPLHLEMVLESLDKHYPLIMAAEQERAIAAGARVAALGVFDHNLKSQNYRDTGTFDNQRYSMFVEQQTPHYGLSYFAGYRLGLGDFPIYYQDRKTGEGGELRAGITQPLLRGLHIDSPRATLAKADIDVAMAEPFINLQRIDISRAATMAYWSWVASGQRYLIGKSVLRIAEDRDAALAKRVQAGNLAQIEREDNRRVIIERQARLVVFMRTFQQAAIQLSLYYRDQHGNPIIPELDRLPAFFEPPPPPNVDQRLKDLQIALERRPEVQRILLQRKKVQVDIDLNENLLLPGVNFGLAGAQDFGQTKKDLYKTWGQAALLIDVPLERRLARGRLLALRAEMARLLAQERFARDRVQMEVQNSLNGLDRAYELLRQGRDNRLQNQYLQDAEERQFQVGKSDLFRVNFRELQAADARILEIDAAVEFYRSLAEYQASLGIDTTKPMPAAPAAK
ncbi:MAG: TolC family protein [Gemmataceae bacterium]